MKPRAGKSPGRKPKKAGDARSKEKKQPTISASTSPHQVQRLEKDYRTYRGVLDMMLEGCQIVGFDWRYLYVNDAAAEQGRRLKEEFLGHTMMEMYPGIEETELFATMKDCLERRIPRRVENEFTYPDGHKGWFDISIQPISEGIFILSVDITERKRLEEKLKRHSADLEKLIAERTDRLGESQERYRALFERSLDAVLLTAPDGSILAANPEACRMFQRSEEDLREVGRNGVVDVTDPRLQVGLQERERAGRFKGELTLKRKDGTKFLGEITTSVYREANGSERTSMIIRDVTERKQAEEQLGRLAAIVESSDDAIIGKTLEGIITSWNRGAEKLYGYKAYELEGRSINILLPPERPNEIPEILQLIGNGRKVEHYETIRLTKDGRRINVLLTVSPVKDRTGRIVGASTIAHDITERKRMEEELRNSEERYRSLAEASEDIIFTVSPDGRFEYINKRGVMRFGLKPEEIIGRRIHDLFSPEDAERIMEMNTKALDSSQPVREELYIDYNDRRVWADVVLAPLRDDAGEISSLLGVSRDITERKMVERMKDQFISSVTHELRTPLGPLMVHVDYVLSGKLGPVPDKIQSSLQVMKRSTERLVNLTNDLLDVRRLEAGKFHLNSQTMDLRTTLTQSIEEMRPLIDEKRQHLFYETPLNPLTVNGDSVRLSQVVTNLLSNASKYAPEESNITVKVEEGEDFIEVRVSDTGLGLRKEDLTRVFETFANIQKPSYIRGTGLGLNLARGLVEAHGGKIWVESEGEGKGSTFKFTLPKLKDETKIAK